MIALGLLFLLTMYIGDVPGAFTLGFVLSVLGWGGLSQISDGDERGRHFV